MAPISVLPSNQYRILLGYEKELKRETREEVQTLMEVPSCGLSREMPSMGCV